MTTSPYNSPTVGIAGQASESLVNGDKILVTGSVPALLPVDVAVAAEQTITDYMVVGLDVSGNLVPAVHGTTQAIGIAVRAITTDDSVTLKGIGVWRAGCFNPDALNWPASYDTDAKKLAAFEGAPSPTQIVLRRPVQGSV